MIPSAPAAARHPHSRRSSARDIETALPENQPVETPPPAYGRPFWLTYFSNSLIMVAVAILFRYADFVMLLGGTEFHLGWIVGLGMVGSLLARVVLGSSIDRHGAKFVWLGSILLLSVDCFAHLLITSPTGIAIFLLRLLYCCALAGIYGASMTFVSGQGPTKRMAEMIGMLGTAGFIGTVVGTVLGDVVFGAVKANHAQIVTMFIASGLISLLSFPLAWLATKSEAPPKRMPHVPLLTVIRRHYSGNALMISMAMGMALGMPGVFLRPYAAQLDIPRIGLFFLVYAVAAIITRLISRRWVERFGNRPIILLGTAGMALSMVALLVVRVEWHLIWPAICFGVSHAIIFPSVVSAGNATFPVHHRGLATLLILGAYDIGQLAGSPLAGAILTFSPRLGWAPYPSMFLSMAGLLAMVCAYYRYATRGRG